MLREEKSLRALQGSTDLKACPIAFGFRILGKRWTIEILREMLYGKNKFNELLHSIPSVSPRMLSLRLRELETSHLVEKAVYGETPVRIEYTLSKSGREVIPVMYSAAEFAMKNFPDAVFENGRRRAVRSRSNVLERNK